jgi:hypothetical protein
MPDARATRLHVMDDPRIRLAHDSLTLLSAAERLQHGAGDRACAAFLPATLDCVEQALHALGCGCHAGANALIPPGESHERISWRCARAAASWPGARAGTGPSHERQAELLASLHATAVALRTATASCARTSDLVAATMEAPASVAELEHRSSTPKAA